MNEAKALLQTAWHPVCTLDDLVPCSGVAVLIHPEGLPSQAVALFWVPGADPELAALAHLEPISGAEVLAHGLLCESQGHWSVASPLYKQHYRLTDGACLEQPGVKVQTWPVRLEGKQVLLHY